MKETGGARIGPYRVLTELGRGGMGRVLLASGPDGRLVALKLIHLELVLDDGFRARFRREIETSRRVSGGYTAAVLDADPEAPVPWLASVFVPGPSLQDAVAASGPLDGPAALRLAAGLASALAEIHRVGLVHRDLKPSNVLLTDDGVRVIDFGIARAADDGGEVTRTGWVVGSPAYMSPEQAEGRPFTAASDVFSLGAVLVMACTGSSPFAGDSTPQTLYRVVHAEPDLSRVPAEVRAIAAHCLAKDPAARPTPANILSTIGHSTEMGTRWPAAVSERIDQQRTAITLLHKEKPAPTRRKFLRVAALGGVVAAAGAGTWALWPTRGPVAGEPFAGHGSDVTSVAFSPDGKVLATGSRDQTVRLWDVASRAQIGEPLRGHGGTVLSVSFSPDGRRLASGGFGEGDTVRFWDVERRREDGKPLAGHYTAATRVLFSADGRTLFTLDFRNVLRFWDVAGRRPGAADLADPAISDVKIRPDERTVVLIAFDGYASVVRLWDTVERRDVRMFPDRVYDADLTGDGGLMATAFMGGSVRLIETSGWRGRELVGHAADAAVNSVVFGAGGRLLASASNDRTVRVWDVGRGEAVGEALQCERTPGKPAFSPDGTVLVVPEGAVVRTWVL